MDGSDPAMYCYGLPDCYTAHAATSTFTIDPGVFQTSNSVFTVIFLGLFTMFCALSALWLLFRFALLMFSPFTRMLNRLRSIR